MKTYVQYFGWQEKGVLLTNLKCKMLFLLWWHLQCVLGFQDALFRAVLSKEKCNNSVTSVDLLFLFILFRAGATCQHWSISLACRLRGISQFLFPGLEGASRWLDTRARPRKVGRGKSQPLPQGAHGVACPAPRRGPAGCSQTS